MAESFQPKFADLVRVYTTTNGTVDFVAGAAVTGFSSFDGALKTGDRFYYCAIHSDRPSEREVGRGTLRADGSIGREPINGSLVNFSGGTKTLSLVSTAEWFTTLAYDTASNSAAAESALQTAQSAQAAAAAAQQTADAAGAGVRIDSFEAIATSAIPATAQSFDTRLNGRHARFLRDPDQSELTSVGQALVDAGTLSDAQVRSILQRVRAQDANGVRWMLDTSSGQAQVEHFGASAVATVDSTPAIQAALDFAAYWSVPIVRVGSGLFKVTDKLVIGSGIQFCGDGYSSVLSFSGTAAPQIFTLINKSDVTIANMRLVPQTGGLNRCAIFGQTSQRLTVRDVWVMGQNNAGGVWLIDCDDCTVDRLYFDGGPDRRGYATYFAGCKRCRVANSSAYRPDFGFTIVGKDIQPMSERPSSEAFGNAIVDCHVSNHDGHAFDIHSAWGNIVSGCSAEDYAGTGINVAFQVKHATGDNAENNVFIGCTVKDCPSGFGMQQGQGTSFIGCTVYNASLYGFLLNDADHTQFIGCKAKEFGLAGIWLNSSCRGTVANGIQLETSTASVIGIQLNNGGGTISFSFFDNILMYGTMAAAIDIAAVASATRFGSNLYLGGNRIVDASTSTVWAERFNSITNVPAASFLGRSSAGTGNAEAMSVDSVKALLGVPAEKTLASDYTNATASFATITDGANAFSWTPPPGAPFEIEALLLIQSADAANLPRIGVSVPAQGTGAYGCISIEQSGATAASRVTADGSFTADAVTVSLPPGDLPAAGTPFPCSVTIRGRSGTSPAPIALQMACETAAAATCTVKAGSRMRTKAG